MPEYLQNLCRGLVPSFSHSMHKGQAGRIAVVGGSFYYTGAPYYAAISALKTGADLSFVFCTNFAAIPIKSYSPELMVVPILPSREHKGKLEEFDSLMKRCHTFVIGPGLGRDTETLRGIEHLIALIRQSNKPMILDGDAIFLLSQDPSILKEYRRAVVTPNAAELERLLEAVFGSDYEEEKKHLSTDELLQELSSELGNVTIVKKGEEDIIANGLVKRTLRCSVRQSSPRRSGGQGDVLSGMIGLFIHWALQAADSGNVPQWNKDPISNHKEEEVRNMMLGIYGACKLLKKCARASYNKHRRGSTTPNIIDEIPEVFQKLYPSEHEFEL